MICRFLIVFSTLTGSYVEASDKPCSFIITQVSKRHEEKLQKFAEFLKQVRLRRIPIIRSEHSKEDILIVKKDVIALQK